MLPFEHCLVFVKQPLRCLFKIVFTFNHLLWTGIQIIKNMISQQSFYSIVFTFERQLVFWIHGLMLVFPNLIFNPSNIFLFVTRCRWNRHCWQCGTCYNTYWGGIKYSWGVIFIIIWLTYGSCTNR